MKKRIKRAVAAGMSLAMGTVIMTSDVMMSPVMAAQINGDNSYAVELYASNAKTYNGFYYIEFGSQITITGYYGDGGDIVIPDKIDGYPVVEISKQHGFSNKDKITSVKIPASVTTIYGEVFKDFVNLKSVTIEAGTNSTSIEKSAFEGCTSLTSITIPGNISDIKLSAFKGCKNLKSFTYLPSVNGITHKIAEYAFQNCESLSQVSLGKGLVSIGDYAFSNDSMLQEIVFPEGINSIGIRTFVNCTKLSKITMPEGLKTIRGEAFKSCTSLKSVEIPSTVTTLTDGFWGGAFANCTSLTSVTLKQGNEEAYMGMDCFNGCTALTSIVIPGNYSKVDSNAFEGCTSLKNFKYAESVNNIEHTIGSYVFKDCISLTNVVLEKGLKTIDSFAFTNTAEETIEFPEGTEKIGKSAFQECQNLTFITIPSTVTVISQKAFYSCPKLTEVNIAEGKNVEAEILDSAFENCKMLKNLVVPGSYKSIGNSAFEGCTNLISFEYKDSSNGLSSQSIEMDAFKVCSNLKEVKLPGTLGSIGEYAFYNCYSLPEIVIPEGVKTIGNYAFSGCSGLESVTIPSTVEGIPKCCFSACLKLKKLLIAKGSIDAEIGEDAFGNCWALTEVSVPGNYVSIHSNAFGECKNLARFSWEKGLYDYNNQSISERAFNNDYNIVLALPSTVGTIESGAIENGSAVVIECEAGSEAENFAKTRGLKYTSYSQPLTINAEITPSGEAENGDFISIRANASGGSLDYQYKLVVYNEDTGKWGIVRDYDETSGFSWKSTGGSRKFYVKVKDSTGKEVTSSALTSINRSLVAKASYKYVNNDKNIEFTASGIYGSGNYKYKFIVYNADTGKWGVIQDYSSKNTCVWDAAGASAGNRKFYVDVKDVDGTVVRSDAMDIQIFEPLKVSLKSSSAKVYQGDSVKLTASAAGGKSGYQYKFIVYNTVTKQWGKVQDYSSSNTCTWVAGTPGTRQFYVDVKDARGKVVRSAVNTISVEKRLEITASISTHADKVGDKVTISGTAAGGAGSYQYKFIVYNKTTKTWGLIQNFSSNNKITWTAGSAGDREFYIDVKDAKGNVVRSSVMNLKTSK